MRPRRPPDDARRQVVDLFVGVKLAGENVFKAGGLGGQHGWGRRLGVGRGHQAERGTHVDRSEHKNIGQRREQADAECEPPIALHARHHLCRVLQQQREVP